jgi:hypothetical protein
VRDRYEKTVKGIGVVVGEIRSRFCHWTTG